MGFYSRLFRKSVLTVVSVVVLLSMGACSNKSQTTDTGKSAGTTASSSASAAAKTNSVKVSTVKWDDVKGKDALWFKTDEGARVMDNVLLYQRSNGGWYKNIDMATVLSEDEKNKLKSEKSKTDTTIDNSATTTQMIVLAKAYTATKVEAYKEGFIKALDYLLKAQYDNGGWPQYYPDKSGYRHQITYNDNAMVNVINLLNDITKNKPEYTFVDDGRRKKAATAVEKGIDCILKTQIVVNGEKTAWCAQHDEVSLKPATARSYELPSISGSESVGIVRLLMGIEKPSAEVIEAVQSAVKWFDKSKIMGIMVTDKTDPSVPGGKDKVVIENPNAGPIWARFYEIETNKPFFCGRDGIKKYTLAEIEVERRTGYSWYGDYPSGLLKTEYPTWQKKFASDNNVLAK